MKCNVILYNSSADKRVVDKANYITKVSVLRGSFREEINLSSPTFIIEINNIPNCNYCYIDNFNRYYYIDNIKYIKNNIFEVRCSVDVLMTYKYYITNSNQYISRQENEYNDLLVDDMVTFDNDYIYTIKEEHLDFLDYANQNIDEYSFNDLTNIVLSTTSNATNYEV